MQTYEKPALLWRMQLGMLPLSPLVCAGQRSRSTSRTPTVQDQVRLHSQPWMNLRLRPAWLETPTEVSPQEDVPALVRIPVKAKAPAHQPCHTIRFLLGPSGVAHSCVSPRLPHALPGV